MVKGKEREEEKECTKEREHVHVGPKEQGSFLVVAVQVARWQGMKVPKMVADPSKKQKELPVLSSAERDVERRVYRGVKVRQPLLHVVRVLCAQHLRAVGYFK